MIIDKLVKYVGLDLFSTLLLILCLLCMSHTGFAETIHIELNTVIDKDTTYSNVTLELYHGSFIIKNNATLNIENCKIIGTISPKNPRLILLAAGKLILKNNAFNLTTENIPANPSNPSLYYSISIQKGNVEIISNHFDVNQPYTIGLLNTDLTPTSQFLFKDNDVEHYHGGILLKNANQASMINNNFSHVSSSNIFVLDGKNNVIKDNIFKFSGNNNVGDAIDIAYSDNISVINNYIASGSCYSILIWNSKNIRIDRNKIISGITYAISINTYNNYHDAKNKFVNDLIGLNKFNALQNANIVITNNYFSQNRYGLSATNIDGLIVKDNVFIQRFPDSKRRQFWTNNDILLKDSVNITWENNLYKEGYAQDPHGDNLKSAKFIRFPLHGGIVI